MHPGTCVVMIYSTRCGLALCIDSGAACVSKRSVFPPLLVCPRPNGPSTKVHFVLYPPILPP